MRKSLQNLQNKLLYSSENSKQLRHSLMIIKMEIITYKISNHVSDINYFKEWWENQGQEWIKELRKVIKQHCKIDIDLPFSEHQKELLQQYYHANKLLVDCMNNACYVSREVRSQIEDELLLPIAEIEARRRLRE
jgi:hypothetical protein